MITYICPDCGHEILAFETPLPICWDDGHVCTFIDADEEKQAVDNLFDMYEDQFNVINDRELEIDDSKWDVDLGSKGTEDEYGYTDMWKDSLY